MLRSIYFTLYDSNLNCWSHIWTQNYAINPLLILQKKTTLRLRAIPKVPDMTLEG